MSAETNREQLEHMLRMYTQGRASSEVVAAVIQARAVLALVEQQRVANLIALAGQVAEPIDGGRVGTSASGVVWMRTEAARLLGMPGVLPEPFGGQP